MGKGKEPARPLYIPDKVLDRIFHFVEEIDREEGEDILFPDDMSEASKEIYYFVPKNFLVPLLSVSRSWRAAGERALYRSISLGSTIILGQDADGDETEIDPACLQRLFLETLKTTPRLMPLVKELRVGTERHAPEDTEMHVKLLDICPDLEHVTIEGYNAFLLTDLKEALARKKKLKTLTVSRYGLCGLQADRFCDIGELFELMENWPSFEKMFFWNEALDFQWEEDEDEEKTEKTPKVKEGCCPKFKEFVSRDSLALFAPALRGLLTVTSSAPLETFEGVFATDKDSHLAMADCLKTWAPRLVNFKLETTYAPYDSLDDTFTNLQFYHLKHLQIPATLVSPSILCKLPAIETLAYYVQSTKDIEALARVLEEQDSNETWLNLKTLQRISLWPLYLRDGHGCVKNVCKASESAVELLEEVSERRGIASYDHIN